MLFPSEKGILFDGQRCTQCGGCLAACKTGSLRVVQADHGLSAIFWEEERCTRCLACVRTCPAHRLPSIRFDREKLGRAKGFVLAHAHDQEVRHRASSGGAGRLLVKSALTQGIVESAYTLKATQSYPWAKGALWRKGDDIRNMPNSMYLPIMVMKNLRIRGKVSGVLVVGTACQLLAADALLEKKVPKLFKVAIYCKQQKDFRATQYCARRLGITTGRDIPGNIHKITYRGGGWPGRIMVNNRDIPYDKAAAIPFGKRLWRVPGCRYCPDAFGHNVDLTLMDPWGIRGTSWNGETLVVVWTQAGQELLQAASAELQVDSLSVMEAEQAINLTDMRRKAALIDYYLGQRVDWRTWLAGKGEELQCRLYEAILDRFNVPPLGHKFIAHAPDLRNIFLSGLYC